MNFMSLYKLETAERRPGQYLPIEIKNPSRDQVCKAIVEMDADVYSELNLISDEREEFTVGGGGNRYVVSILTSEGENMTLLNKEAQRSLLEIELVVGGSITILHERYINSRDSVLETAMYFFEHHSAAPNFAWE
jgi:hypothetical protein